MADYSGLFPKTKGQGANKGLASIFENNQFLRNWRPTQEEPRGYTTGGVWNRAYIDTHGDLPSQLRDAWRNYQESGFYRRRNPDTNLWEYRSYIPATFETLRQTGAHSAPDLVDYVRRNDQAGFQQWKDTWEQVGGPVAPQLRGNQHWNRYAADPAVQAFLDRYAPDPARSPVAPQLNIPRVVEALANQQADRRRRAGGLYSDAIETSADDLRRRLAADPGIGEARTASENYRNSLSQIAELLRGPLNIEADPSYQLRQTEGRRAIDAMFGGAGLAQTGARHRALVREASDIAGREYAAADARRRANAQAETGIRKAGFDALIEQINRRSDQFQEREREYTRAEQYGLGAEYQSALEAITQLGLGQGAALDRIIEERDAESDRRDLEYLRGIQNEQRRKAEAEARAAAKRARRGKLYSDILGAAGQAAGMFLGGPALAEIAKRGGQAAGERAGE